MNKEKTGNRQLYSLTACVTCGSPFLAIASLVTRLCGHDGWIASVTSSLFGTVFILLYYALGQLPPDKGLIQIIHAVFGKWLGAITSIYFAIFCIHNGIQVTAYIGQFIATEYLITLSVYSINLLILIVMAGVLLYGLKTTTRSFEILLKVVTSIMAFPFLTDISDVKVHYIQPVLENGFYPIFKGSLYITSYHIWPLILLNMIYPVRMGDSSSTLRAMLKGYFLGSLIMFPVMLVSIPVLGTHVTSVFVYPTYSLTKQISSGFLFRAEGLIVGAWLVTLFFKGFCYFYAGVQSTSIFIRLEDCRKTVCPILFVVLIYSNTVYPGGTYLAFWDKYAWISYSFTARFLLPAFIVIVYFTQKTLQRTNRSGLMQDSA